MSLQSCKWIFAISLVLLGSTVIVTTDGPPLVVISVLADPFLMRVDDPLMEGNDRYEGFSKDFMDKLFQKLNRNYILKVEPEGNYGVRDVTNGTWNGMIGALISGEADFAIADLTISKSRLDAVDFSLPYMQARLGILMKKPQGSEVTTTSTDIDTSIGGQFSTGLWLIIGTITVLTIFLVHILNKYITQRVIHIYPKWVKTCVSVQCLQFGFIIFLLFVLAILSTNFLAAKMANLLLRSGTLSTPLQINSIQELANQTEVEYGILRSGSTFNYFRSSMSDDLIEFMYRKMLERKGLLGSYDQGIRKVRSSNGSFAFLMESLAAKFATVRKPCDLIVAPQLFGPKKGYGVAMPKNSPKIPQKEIDLAILDLNEQGVLPDLENKWFNDQTECDDDVGGELKIHGLSASPLTMNDLGSAFVVLSIAVISICIFTISEYLVIRK